MAHGLDGSGGSPRRGFLDSLSALSVGWESRVSMKHRGRSLRAFSLTRLSRGTSIDDTMEVGLGTDHHLE